MTPYILTLVSIQLHRISELSVPACNLKMFFMQCEDKGEWGAIFSSSQRSLKCELVSYFGSINSKYRWFAAPLYTGPPRFPVMECYRGVEWHQHNWFDELSSPGQHSTKQTGRATNSAPFIFNYSLLTSLADNVTPGKNGGGICCEKKKYCKRLFLSGKHGTIWIFNLVHKENLTLLFYPNQTNRESVRAAPITHLMACK